MKKTTLLNRHLSELVASLGHLDEIVIADAGLPVPPNMRVIDLAVMAGVPSLFNLVHALSSELVIEKMVFAEEAPEALATLFETERSHWANEQGKSIEVEKIAHTAFKERTQKARAIIRTGSVKPYCNLILVSGVAF